MTDAATSSTSTRSSPTRPHLLVGDGHRIYWEQSGNPEGVAFPDGGPGAAPRPGT